MAEVSRETWPAPDPGLAAAVFPPARLSLAERYAGWLAADGVTRGLIGPREIPRLWERHLVNCALLGPLVPEGASVVDLGSGAGLPGLVLAIARPDLRVTLVEPMARRVAFLTEVCADLRLDAVEIVRARAEQWAEAPTYDVVTARALAPLAKLLGWGMPLVAQGGALLAMKGSSAADEITAAERELVHWSATAEIVSSSVPGSPSTTVVRVVRDPGAGIGWPPGTAVSTRTTSRRGHA